MKFHFGSHHHHHGGGAGGVVVPTSPTDHPSALLVVDAHGSPGGVGVDTQGHAEVYGTDVLEDGAALDLSRHRGHCVPHRPSPLAAAGMAFFHPSTVASRHFGSPGSSPRSPLGEDQASGVIADLEAVGTVKHGSPTSKRALHLEGDHHDHRPRSRQFFRLGRHRSKGTDDSADDLLAKADVLAPCCGLTSDSSDDDELGGKRTRRMRKAAIRRSTGSMGVEVACRGVREEDELGGSERTRRAARRPRRGIAKLRRPSIEEESSGSERAPPSARRPRRGIPGLRKLRRAQSLPTADAFDKAAEMPAEEVKPAGASPTIETQGPFDAMDYGSPHAARANTSPPYSAKLSRSVPDLPSEDQRRVTFACVQIREYSTILGDHPCCPSGPPLSLGWELQREDSVELERYEKERAPVRCKSKDDLRLKEDERRGILRGLVVPAAAPSGDSEAEGSSTDEKSDDDHHKDDGKATALYSARELCRAERRLLRDRAGINARAHRRMNNRFFRQPLAPGESAGLVVASAVEKEEAREDAPVGPKEVGSTSSTKEEERSPRSVGEPEEGSCPAKRMDISPTKSRTMTGEF